MLKKVSELRRNIYKLGGPPTIPLNMIAGSWVIEYVGHRMPFIKFASKERYSFHLPPRKSEAWKRFRMNIVRRGVGSGWSPHAVTMAITSKCNANCAHCSAFRRDSEGSLTTEQWCDVIDQCAELGLTDLIITGGEPFLFDDIDVLVKRIVDNGCVCDIFTNGTLLTEENINKVKEAGCESFFVSLDSPFPEEHDALRGMPGMYKEIEQGIRRAVGMGMSVGISTYASHESIQKGYHEEMVSIAKKLGVKEITIFDLVPTGKRIKDDTVLLSAEEKDVIRTYQEKRWTDIKGPRICYMGHVNNQQILGCFGVRWQIHITNGGFVTPCDFMPLHFGNLKEEKLVDIWNKMVVHPEYDHKVMSCRIQEPSFRERYIHSIPEGASLPFPIEEIERDKARKAAAGNNVDSDYPCRGCPKVLERVTMK